MAVLWATLTIFSMQVDYPLCLMLSNLSLVNFCVRKVGLKQIVGQTHCDKPVTLSN